MESRDVLHNSTTSEELSQTCIDQTTCVKVPAQDIPHDIADRHQDHQRHNHQSQHFGRNLHLAMACINGTDQLKRSKTTKAISTNKDFPKQNHINALKKNCHQIYAAR